MKAFRFNLQRILEFRQTRLTEAERRLKLAQLELGGFDRRVEDVRRTRLQSASTLVAHGDLRARDLQALENYKTKLIRTELALLRQRAVCAQKVREQQEAYKSSRKEFRLLEELRKRRFAEWLQATNREMDQLASDLYLARWDQRSR